MSQPAWHGPLPRIVAAASIAVSDLPAAGVRHQFPDGRQQGSGSASQRVPLQRGHHVAPTVVDLLGSRQAIVAYKPSVGPSGAEGTEGVKRGFRAT